MCKFKLGNSLKLNTFVGDNSIVLHVIPTNDGDYHIIQENMDTGVIKYRTMTPKTFGKIYGIDINLIR